jgi:hypothetical protein
MKNIIVNGLVTVTYSFEVSEANFAQACKQANLYPQDFKNFRENDWLRIRKHLTQLVIDNEYNLSYDNVHSYDSISVDEVTLEDNDMTHVHYEIEDAVHEMSINDQKVF